jgi:isoleucyl-tRNA synthetase
VKDTSATVQFKVIKNEKSNFLFDYLKDNYEHLEVYILAWTTTPWTLPSNCALAVGSKISYRLIVTDNPYTNQQIAVVLASDLVSKYFLDGGKGPPIHYSVEGIYGEYLAGIRYEQLLPFAQPESGDNFKVITGDFVSTEDGTGIVHIAPSFGADDMRVGKQNGVGALTLVDKRGKFLPEVKDDVFLFGEEYVKEAYLSDDEKQTEFEKQKAILEANGKIKELKSYLSVDDRIVLKLQEENKLFKKEKYEHNYPHCWRTDKPILYYPLDSWFIKTTAIKERMVELNKTINWKPESTGTGRFGNWLENLVDWNLSRSRYWGTPLPIWRTEDGTEEICIGSVEELNEEIEKSINAGFLKSEIRNQKSEIDLHKPFVDEIILVSSSGKKMLREADLIDVWFDSGAMPYAQWHYPFENKEVFEKSFPADFISEGVDQTRGWFFTLHAIGTMLMDSVAFKNVVSNGLVLDKNGNKMSKRLGNTVEPFETIAKYGADATRWYMITNAQPWDNLKFDINGIGEVQRKFFGTLFNTYSFFSLYANIDGFQLNEQNIIPVKNRPEIDRWIISKLNTLIKEVDSYYDDYEPTKAGRAVQDFVDEHLSNWYVRLCRRRFWKGEMNEDKQAAYETLFECLITISQLMSPVAPFFADWLYQNLTDNLRANGSATKYQFNSVHLSHFIAADESLIDESLNYSMQLAQEASSLVLSLRKKANIKVRQPLSKVLIPSHGDSFEKHLLHVSELIKSEVNVKQIDLVRDLDFAKKKIKPNFRNLGKIFGKEVPKVVELLQTLSQQELNAAEKAKTILVSLNEKVHTLSSEEFEIITEDIPGWELAGSDLLTVALDITISEELKNEGFARELVNRIQNLRKEKDFNVTDRISIRVEQNPAINDALNNYKNYICTEVLAEQLIIEQLLEQADVVEVNENPVKLIIERKNQ